MRLWRSRSARLASGLACSMLNYSAIWNAVKMSENKVFNRRVGGWVTGRWSITFVERGRTFYTWRTPFSVTSVYTGLASVPGRIKQVTSEYHGCRPILSLLIFSCLHLRIAQKS
jgi:hypothetical protein